MRILSKGGEHARKPHSQTLVKLKTRCRRAFRRNAPTVVAVLLIFVIGFLLCGGPAGIKKSQADVQEISYATVEGTFLEPFAKPGIEISKRIPLVQKLDARISDGIWATAKITSSSIQLALDNDFRPPEPEKTPELLQR